MRDDVHRVVGVVGRLAGFEKHRVIKDEFEDLRISFITPLPPMVRADVGLMVPRDRDNSTRFENYVFGTNSQLHRSSEGQSNGKSRYLATLPYPAKNIEHVFVRPPTATGEKPS